MVVTKDIAIKKSELEKLPEIKTDKPIPFKNEFEIGKLLKTAGTVKLTEVQKKKLYAPVKDEDIEIRPDGMIYLPWVDYADKLHKAFSMEWALIPQGMPKLEGNLVMWGFYLIIKGSLMAYAVGGQEYYPNNPKMNWADAAEGASSSALMRLCKKIGIANELWSPSFIRRWKAKYSESYPSKDKYGKPITLWRRKSVPKRVEPEKQKSIKNITPKPEKVEPENKVKAEKEKQKKSKEELIKEAQIKAIHIKWAQLGKLNNKYNDSKRKKIMLKLYQVYSTKDMTFDQLADFIGRIEIHIAEEEKLQKPPL